MDGQHTASGVLAALLRGGADGDPALVSPEDGQVITYGDLADRVATLSGRLARAGVRRGDRVALALPNSPDFVALILAVTGLGAAAAPLNPAYTGSELEFYLGDIAPRLLLLPPRHPAGEQAAATTATPVAVVSSGDAGMPELSLAGEIVRAAASFEPGVPDDVALVLHTSGTTSRPKQVPLLQRNIMSSVGTIAAHYRLGRSDVSFCLMPLFHVHGLIASAFSSLHLGGTTVVPRRFTPQRFWPQARQHAVTWLSAGPTLHQMILERDDGEGAPERLRFTRSCSSALSPALLARAEDTYGVPMLEAYGMTEASHQMTSNPLPPAERRPGSVGVPAGAEVGIVGDELAFLPEGTAGEVVVRGPGITPGYVNNPEANAEAFFGDGWFRTGDFGSLEGGYLTIRGRIKEIIIRGGENISPVEVEAVLLSHPAVREAVCFGMADEKYGETVAAAVTLAEEVEVRALVEHCRQQLAAVKVPTTVHVLAEIPRTPTGKVQRRRMPALLAERGSPPS
ncbi:MAG TPA: AMP-binding protein [Acidimicrobiales bacterium]|nr:AMP-binding protein [Acidimicrobiales bacterium]